MTAKTPTFVCLSDQNEHKYFALIAEYLKQKCYSVLINTRPFTATSEIARTYGNLFVNYYGWENLYANTANVFFCTKEDENHVISILKKAQWPQSLEEVLASDQYYHWKTSGRFYQKHYNRDYLINSFLSAYELMLLALETYNITCVYAYVIRDVNKIGAICACLERDIPVMDLVSTNVYGASFLRVLERSRTKNGVFYKYIGRESDEPIVLFSNFETYTQNGKAIIWKLGSLPTTNELHKNYKSKESTILNHNRKIHKEKNSLDTKRIIKTNLLLIARYLLFNIPIRIPLETTKVLLLGSWQIPLHRKNKRHFIQAYLLKHLFHLICSIRSTLSCFHVLLKTNKQIGSFSYIVPLHYFPESSTLGGLSWHNCKNELALFAEPKVKDNLLNNETIFVEHPVYLEKGERPSYFWKQLRQFGYRHLVKSSRGVNLDGLGDAKIITISGSIALEAASNYITTFVAKNTHLLLIDNVYHISDLIGSEDWTLQIEGRKLLPQEYFKISMNFGLKENSDVAETVFNASTLTFLKASD